LAETVEGHVLGADPFIDTGDRVVTTAGLGEPQHARLARPEHVGKRGVVISNDGWGLCTVELEDGSLVTAWNIYDLERYVEEAE